MGPHPQGRVTTVEQMLCKAPAGGAMAHQPSNGNRCAQPAWTAWCDQAPCAGAPAQHACRPAALEARRSGYGMRHVGPIQQCLSKQLSRPCLLKSGNRRNTHPTSSSSSSNKRLRTAGYSRSNIIRKPCSWPCPYSTRACPAKWRKQPIQGSESHRTPPAWPMAKCQQQSMLHMPGTSHPSLTQGIKVYPLLATTCSIQGSKPMQVCLLGSRCMAVA